MTAPTAAASKGKYETELLRANINDQLTRLFTQLEDIEEFKDDLKDEYEEEKKETLAQLAEFQEFMNKQMAGDMTLVDEFSAAQLAIQAAISQAFKTPEVIQMFAKKQPDQLRKRLATLQRDFKIKKLTQDAYNQGAVEVLQALKKIGEKLTAEEADFLEKLSSSRLMEAAGDKVGAGAQTKIMASASSQIASAQ